MLTTAGNANSSTMAGTCTSALPESFTSHGMIIVSSTPSAAARRPVPKIQRRHVLPEHREEEEHQRQIEDRQREVDAARQRDALLPSRDRTASPRAEAATISAKAAIHGTTRASPETRSMIKFASQAAIEWHEHRRGADRDDPLRRKVRAHRA